MQIIVMPSMLAADFGHLSDEAKRAEAAGADALHLDIMDGHFVPNLSMGPDIVEAIRRAVNIPLSVHLMLSRPDQYLHRFIDAGAHSLQIHIEASCDVPEALERIRDLGARPGITLNPETRTETIYPVLRAVDEVLCMTVHPGYGGQSFMAGVLPKVRAIRDFSKTHGRQDMSIIVDGGIVVETAGRSAAMGANSFVAGTSLFKAADMAAEIALLRQRVSEHLVL